MDIRLKDVNISFEHQGEILDVLRNLSIEVKAGEFVAILGPSGCGKTTLLKVMAGFHEGGTPRKEIFMIHQDFNQLFPWRTLGDNLHYAIRKAKKGVTASEGKRKAREALEAVGLAEFYHYFPHQLSGGMKQRGALARALAMESRILLMDEPFSSLDRESKEGAYQLLKKLWKERNLTVVFVTHDLEEARALSGKIIYFEDINGKI
jgi:ABC-type nitrate/sulfonate/bicarbonate transport system ATPase subunit